MTLAAEHSIRASDGVIAPLPRRLAAAPPGWEARADVVVVGSGIAGLTAALHARRSGTVLLVTKALLEAGSTRWAQGGIAAAVGPGDTPDDHLRDTLVAGAGLCDPEAVRVLVTEGPGALADLIALGAAFDRDPDGTLQLTREGGHLRDRIAHAGGDATGAEVSRALVAAVRADPGIEVIEHALVLDLLTGADGAVTGATLHVIGEGQRDGVGSVRSRAVILATGGMGQVYSQTTNPPVATGDGVAVALRAGADVADLEFVQFHPTVMYLGPESSGQQPLISEAVRGEGAFLVDDAGVRFMLDQHELADLAPRDVVAKAITRRMRSTDSTHVWLDGRHLGVETWSRRFPTILETLAGQGLDPVRDLIPVAPACHFASGGVRTDLDGRTSVRGLYAVGEVACTGVHGANRLASNSLLEGLVFAARVGRALDAGLPPQSESRGLENHQGLVPARARRTLTGAMTAGAGVLRSDDSLAETLSVIGDVVAHDADADPCTDCWEAANLATVAAGLAGAARLRTETRGSHWREDYPDRDDDVWRVRLVQTMDAKGALSVRSEPVADQDIR